ncbi:hypothetical protein C1645_829712 [Glomus cerebriforme]|uniref:Ion transport domain-containing protein n=1 Tax=Glomus cerebriforme TaxID=658196 RepID=A0A397SNF8_9GLOM|nr:hypothetical protein C1645_829712 [Glomus cerebriforme]
MSYCEKNRFNEFEKRDFVVRLLEYDAIIKKEDYQIAICRNGKFAVTFDTANLRIKILKNTDYRSITRNNNDNESDEIDKIIAYFKIREDLTIAKFYRPQESGNSDNSSSGDVENRKNTLNKGEKFRWSFDISNICKNENKYFIYVAVSHIDIDSDMKGENKYEDESDDDDGKDKDISAISDIDANKHEKRTAIYRIEVKKEDSEYILKEYTKIVCYFRRISGICRFVEESDNKEGDTLKRFILLNFQGIHGIHNFDCGDDFNSIETFHYPKSIKRELDYWHSGKNLSDCMDLLLSCNYDKYFLIEQYKHHVQLLEVYDLIKMKLETIAKRVENKDKHIRRYNSNVFSICNKKLQLCFTRGLQSIKMFFMENGLEVASKKFDEIEKIYSLEFIDNDEKLLIIGSHEQNLKLLIWDMYNTGVVEKVAGLNKFITIENLTTCLARTSGNILQIDNKGKVTSVLKRVENILSKQKEETDKKLKLTVPNVKTFGTKLNGDTDKRHTIYFDKYTISPIVEKEPWVIGDYDRNSYCLYYNKKETETENLQLIVGRSTAQIWHQIHDKTKKKEDIPNKGEPFLEYIWSNGIPVNQEREKTRLRIREFKYEESNNILNDFYLEVYWYERSENIKFKKNVSEEEKKKIIKKEIKEEDEEIVEMEKDENKEAKKGEKVERKTKLIRRKDIDDKVNAVRHACKALEHLNKRTKYLVNYVREHRYEEMVAYINHIIWRFIRYKPDEYRLLDVRHNVMKNLILGDCDHLIKFILFGNDDEENNKNGKPDQFIIKHIPRSLLWKKDRKFVKDDDIECFDDKPNERDKVIPSNDMELAIYHCKGRELKDTIIVAYLLEYYSSHATDYAGWMNTVSKALPLLYKYNYDDYTRKLFRKECFADQDHFSAQDPYEIIPEEQQVKCNRDTEFRAFRPIVKLESDREYKLYNWTWRLFKHVRIRMYQFFGDFDNDIGKPPLALRVVPLPEFIIHSIPKKKAEYDLKKYILNIFLFIFIPRYYKIDRNNKKLLSPFSRVVLYENNDDMYDNPATEAVIDFLSWTYLVHNSISEHFRNFLVALIVIFYYLAIYLFATELIQLRFHGIRKYFDIYNIFDVLSVVIPVIVMSIMLLNNFLFSDGFGSIEIVDTGLVVGISSSVFIIWIETILYLRLIPNIATYIFYVMIIFETVFPFILFTIVVIIAFAHTMFVLLKNTKMIPTKNTTFHGVATNPLTNQDLNITMQTDFDPNSRTDNPFSTFITAIVAAYFWLNGNWVQRDEFDFWAVDVFTLIASILLVTILQNMLIAFMGGVYEKAATKDYEDKSNFKKHIFEEKNYDKYSIWKYDEDTKMEIEKIKNMKNGVNVTIEYLINKLKEQENVSKKVDNNEANDNDIEINDDNIKAIEEKIKKIDNMKDVNAIFEDLLDKLKSQ